MLAIDIGNSRIKWAVFYEGELSSYQAVEYSDDTLASVLEKEDLPISENSVMISNVAGERVKFVLMEFLISKQCTDFMFAETRSEQCQVINSYETVSNMGVDRWLAMLAAYHSKTRKKNEAVCVIDCGTAITIDVVSEKGVHLGGLIMPGYQLMVSALMGRTSEIRQGFGMGQDIDMNSLLGKSTSECVPLGCSHMVNSGISGIVDNLIKSHQGELRCLVTGGDGESVMNKLNCKADYVSHLVLEGLRLVSCEASGPKNINN